MASFLSRIQSWFHRAGTPSERPDYSIRKEDRDCFRYRAGDRELTVEGSLGFDPDYVIYARDTWYWLPPHETEAVTPEEKSLILDRLGEWLRRRRMTYRIEE